MRRRLAARWHRLPRWVRWPLWAGRARSPPWSPCSCVLWFTVDLPDEDPLEPQSAVLVPRTAQELAVLVPGRASGSTSALDEVAPVVVDAVVAAEDRRFYDHGGIDPIGIARALAQQPRRRPAPRAGRRITQQLVKNAYLTETSARSAARSSEAVLPMKLEQSEDKDQILERYLNTVYFGRGAYGIEAAARVYFDTSAPPTSTPQAALLVGLLRSPETADPPEDPEEATRRARPCSTPWSTPAPSPRPKPTPRRPTPIQVADAARRASRLDRRRRAALRRVGPPAGRRRGRRGRRSTATGSASSPRSTSTPSGPPRRPSPRCCPTPPTRRRP